MKQIVTFAIILFSLTTFAQKSEIPEPTVMTKSQLSEIKKVTDLKLDYKEFDEIIAVEFTGKSKGQTKVVAFKGDELSEEARLLMETVTADTKLYVDVKAKRNKIIYSKAFAILVKS